LAEKALHAKAKFKLTLRSSPQKRTPSRATATP
jgi:hypothetical protein